MEDIRKRYFELAKERNMTMEDVAERARENGVRLSKSVISKILSGKYRGSFRHKIEIARALNCKYEELWEMDLS
jgi:transcriptional regulator with XRE-family HTH domain